GLAVNDAATLVGDSNQSLRAGGALMMREIMQAGRGIPTGGIPIPNGAGVTPISRPGPPTTSYTFGDPTTTLVIPPVVPGPRMGPTVLGVPTDMVTLMLVDLSLPLDQYQLTNIAADGSNVTVDPRTNISDPATGIQPGDLIMFQNAV